MSMTELESQTQYIPRKSLARALYVDHSVNVVQPKSKRSTKSQVKPGQMNLFNPGEKEGMTVDSSVILNDF